MVAEMISSAHDVIEMESFLHRLKSNYEKLYPSQKLSFRFVVCDFSWSLIISLVQILNGMDQIEYSNLVFEYAKGGELREDISWLISMMISIYFFSQNLGSTIS